MHNSCLLARLLRNANFFGIRQYSNVYVPVIVQWSETELGYYRYFDGVYHFVHARCCSALPKKNFQCAMQHGLFNPESVLRFPMKR